MIWVLADTSADVSHVGSLSLLPDGHRAWFNDQEMPETEHSHPKGAGP